MVNIVYAELLKLKRAKMFMVSLMGAAAAPIMMFIGFLSMKSKTPDAPITFDVSFYNTNLYVLLLIGPLLYGVITAYLFTREYTEGTLENLLTIPISRISLIISKMILLFTWIAVLTLFAWGLTLTLGLIGQFEGLHAAIVVQSLKEYMIGASLLFLLSTPTILVTFLFKNYVPTIIFTAVITMGNIALASSEYRVLFPWSAVHTVANGGFVPEYPPEYSYLSIFATFLIGFMATILYFKKVDIQ